MSDTYFRRDGKQITGTDGSSGYDEGNRLIIEGKTYYKEGNNRYFCPEDGRIYIVDNGSISTLEDGIIGTYSDYDAKIDKKFEKQKASILEMDAPSKTKIDEKTAMGIYIVLNYAKKHIIGLVIFFCIFQLTFIVSTQLVGSAYSGFFISLLLDAVISAFIEKCIKIIHLQIKDGIHRKNIQGIGFLIVSILTAICAIGFAYCVWDGSNYINETKQYITEHPTESHSYQDMLMESTQKSIDEFKLMILPFALISVVSGGIFVIKNNSKNC